MDCTAFTGYADQTHTVARMLQERFPFQYAAPIANAENSEIPKDASHGAAATTVVAVIPVPRMAEAAAMATCRHLSFLCWTRIESKTWTSWVR